MKCERCGCEIKGAPSVISNYDNYGFCIRANHGLESDCIAALKAKLAEKFTSEPTKPERFATLRLFTRQHHPVYNDVIPELNDLFAAYDEANELIVNVLGLNADITKLHDWLKKWS
jgi:hypothetical protein